MSLKNSLRLLGVIFEDISLDTLEEKNEFVLGIISLIAQGESEMKSAAITWSVIERFKKGIPIISTHNLLGYDKDHLNRLVIVEEEAEVIRYIYECYLDGQTIREIAKSLTDSHVPTPTGKNVWSGGTIRSILRNEKYCGDVIMQKTFTVDCFSHKAVINRGQREQYYIKDHHNAIIPRKDWERVQIMLMKPRRQSNGKHNKPEEKFRITRIKSGHLKGFAVIDCQWKETDIDKFFYLLNSYYYKRR